MMWDQILLLLHFIFHYSPKAIFDKSTLNNSGGKGYTDMFFTKYNPYGDSLWSENAIGCDREWSNGVAIDKQGNIYVTGGFDSRELCFGTTKLLSLIGKSFFIAKINAK